jgi:peroxiredoxin
LQGVVSEIEQQGATLVAICPQRPEFLKKMREKHNLSFDILRDEGNRYAEKLGLRFVFPEYLQEIYLGLKIDVPRVNGDSPWSMAMPARYVVNQQGIVIAADFDPDYTSRPEPEKVLADLQSIT